MGSGPLLQEPLEAREREPSPAPGASSSGSASAFRSLLRACCGALLGAVPLLVSMLMAPSNRSPYLLAYPAVILAAWVWGLRAAVACAAVSGLLIEHYIFQTHQITLSPIPNGWVFREVIFLGGSLMVGALTRSAAHQRQEIATANLNQRLRLAEAEAAVATEKAIATELEPRERGALAPGAGRSQRWPLGGGHSNPEIDVVGRVLPPPWTAARRARRPRGPAQERAS